MPLLQQVVSTDNTMTTLAKTDPAGLARLETVRQRQILAVGIGLSGITANALPAVLKHGEQLSLLRKKDEPTLLKALIILIGLTNEALNLPRMNAAQMIDAARHIVKTFWYLKPEEIAYAFDQGRAGCYGPAYNRLDLEGLEKWLRAYDTGERLALCERARSEPDEEIDARLSVKAVQESYQRFADGEPLLQQKKDADKREGDRQERIARSQYYQFRENYFATRNQSTDTETPQAE